MVKVSKRRSPRCLAHAALRRIPRLALPLGPIVEFSGSRDDIEARLEGVDEAQSVALLQQAQEIFAAPAERARHAEGRATTLQGAAAIVASFTLAGAGLLLDPSRIPSEPWRIALAVGYSIVVLFLTLATARSLWTIYRKQTWHFPDGELALGYSTSPAPAARARIAASLLWCAGRNERIANWKVAQMRAAAFWFGWAVASLLVVALLLASYAWFGPEVSSTDPSSTRASHPHRSELHRGPP